MNSPNHLKKTIAIIQLSDGSIFYLPCSIRKKKLLIEKDIRSNILWKNMSSLKNLAITKSEDKHLDNLKRLFLI